MRTEHRRKCWERALELMIKRMNQRDQEHLTMTGQAFPAEVRRRFARVKYKAVLRAMKANQLGIGPMMSRGRKPSIRKRIRKRGDLIHETRVKLTEGRL